MKKINLFSRLWSSGGNSQSSDVGCDCRLTVGSPSGIKSSKVLKFMSVLVLVLTIGVGNAWGALTEEYSYTFTAKQFANNTTAKTLGSITWTPSTSWKSGSGYWGYDGTKGQQWGSSSNTLNTLTITAGSSISNIKKITINASTASSGYCKLSVKVGSTAIGSEQTLTSTATDYDFESATGLSGAVQIKMVNNSKAKAQYIKSITIYTEDAVTPTLTVSGDATSLAMGDAKVNGSVTNNTLTFSGANLTANATLSITGTNASMFTVSPTSVTPVSKTITDQTITVTYSPTAAGSHSATLTISSGTATPKTIALTGTGKYEVIWQNNGGDYETTLVASGQRPTFPAAPGSCDAGEGASTTFYGWSTGTWSGKINDLAGKTIYTSAASMPTVSANGTTYHAVFCKGGALSYATSIAANDVVYLATSTASGASGVTGANANGKDADVSTTQADWMPFTVQTNSTGWKLQNGTNYIQATVKNFAFTTSTPNVLTFVQEGSTGKYRMIFTSSGTDYALGKNSSGDYWRFYSTTNSYNWYYVLKASAGTNYMTTCAVTHTVSSAVDPTGKATVTLGATTVAEGGTTTATHSAITTGYEFVNWTITGTGASLDDATANPVTITMGTADVTVTANLSAINYTITYNLNGGTNPGGAPTGFTVESSDITLPTPTRTGYSFAGWYENADLSTGGVKTTITSGTHENKTYYAKWTVNWKFMYNGDSYAEHTFDNSKEWTQSLDGNTTYWFRISDGGSTVYRLAGASTMTSANCTDWNFPKNANTDCGIQTTAPGNYVFTLSDADPNTKVQISVTYPSSVVITLNLNGHGDDITWYAATGGVIPTPADPVAAGYTFAGWYSDAGCNTPWNFSTTVNSATTLYSKWTQYYYYHEEWTDDWAANQMTESADGNYWYWYTYASPNNRQFKIQQGGTWYGYTYNSPGFNCTDITNMNSSANSWSVIDNRCAVNYNGGRYYIIVYVPNTSINTTNNPIICASTTLPEVSYDMAAGRKIYFDNADRQWTNVYYRIGRACHNSVAQMTKVPGTQNLYQTTTAAYTNYIAFHIADNQANSGDHSIYDVRPGSNNISNCINFQKEAVAGDITLTPTTLNNTEASCNYYNVTETSGMKSHNVSITAPTNGTITVGYSPADGSAATSFTSGNRDLAHTCILTISAAGATGYHLDGLTVNGDAFSSGNTYILSADAVVAATFAANTNTAYTVKHYKQKLDGTYDASPDETDNLEGTTGASVTPARKSYEGFTAPSGQTVTILADGSRVVEYQYSRNSYTLTWSWNGGNTSSTTHTAAGSVLYGATLSYPANNTMSKTGYGFTGWSSTPETMPASATTITAQWTAKEDTYNTALHTGASGWTSYASGVTKSGAGYTIPNPGSVAKGATSTCEDTHYHFAGWVADDYKGSPSGHIIDASGTTDATGTTYWAVWEKEAAGGGSLTKLTSAYVPTEGDNLVIVAVDGDDKYALYQQTISSSYVAFWNFSNDAATVGADDKNYVTLVSDGGTGWYLGDATNGYVYNGSSNNLTVDANSHTSFSITWNSSGFNIVGNSRWLSCRTDLTGDNDNKYRMGGATSGNASGTALFDLYKYVGVSYTDPIAACAAVTCGAPTSATNTSVTAFGATIGWTENSPGTLDTYEYAVWVHGEVEPTSGYSTAATNSATITGKTCSTQYDWKVRKVCTDDDGESEFLYSSFTTSNVTLSFDVSGVSGVSSVANQASNVALPTPSPNAVPTSCGECWEFTGWTPSSSYTHGTSKFFAAGSIAHLESGDGTTLYPVYARDEFKLVSTLADISADNYYVLTMDIEDNDEFALLNTVSGNNANVLDILDPTNYLQIRYGSYWLYNPPTSIIWKMTGTTSSGSLYNEAGDVYLDLASSSNPILKSGTPPSHSLLIELYDMGTDLEGNELLDVYNISNSGNYLSITSSEATISTEARSTDEFSAYIYKRISCTYTTSPSCTYTVTWNNNGSTSTTDVSICAGELSNEQMPNTSSYSLDCADKFVGWSRSNLGADLGQSAPDDLFSTAAASPYIRNDEEFFAVYATEDDESSSYVDDVLNQSLTGVSGTSYVDVSDLTDASGAVYAGKCAGDNSSIQLNSTSPNAIVTTTSGGLARKVTVVWESHTANGRTLDIYGKNTAYSSGADLWDDSKRGTKLGSIVYGTSTELTITDDYEFIGFRSSSSAMYLTSVTIKWEQPGYKDYVTTCCDKTVTLSSNVTGQGAVSFSAAALATCVAGSATMTITPTAGYKLTAFNTEGTTATPNSMVPVGGVTVPSESTQIITLNYNANATGAYVANPTFEAILVSSLTLHAQKLDNEDNVIFDQTSNAVTLSMYPTEGKTASPADILGHKASISFGAVLPANALNTGYTWSATVNGSPVEFTSNTLNTNSVIEFNKGTGKLVAKAAGTAVITITANDASGVSASVTITVTNQALTSVSTTPASLTVYSGQLLPVVVNYDPVNVTTKGYSYSGDDNVTIRNKGNDGFNVEGNSVSVDTHNDLVITTTSDSRQTTLPITIKPLPKVHFVDIVHGESFADVAATIDPENQGIVLFDRHAPTHADISPAPSTPNECENTHLHLIGWIDSEWSGVANYMNNTASKPTTEAIIGATGYFLAPNAEIDTDALKNKTFYAVWAIEE